jgi:hypothetical protein
MTFLPQLESWKVGKLPEEVLVFGHVEAGAGLVGVFSVAVQGGTGIAAVEVGQQTGQGLPLCGRARVLGLPDVGFLRASYIADPDGVEIVVEAMGAYFFFGTACMDAAVEVNQVVVADTVSPVSVIAMPIVHVFDGHMPTLRRGRTMNDNSVNASHCLFHF